MNLQEIRYSDVQKDDTLFIKTEKNKKGEPVKVVEVELSRMKMSGMVGQIEF